MHFDAPRVRQAEQAMAQELSRTVKSMRLPGHPKPFFLSHLLRASQGLQVWGRYGSVFRSEPFTDTDLYTNLRVGSYQSDQTVDGGIHTDHEDRESYQWTEGPTDLSPNALRYAFWKLSQFKYEEALHDYYEKRKIMVGQRLSSEAADFSKESKLIHRDHIEDVRFPRKKWENMAREASNLFTKHRKIMDPYVRFRGVSAVRIIVNSEGTRCVCQENFVELTIQGWIQSKDGVYLDSMRRFYGRNLNDLPNMKRIRSSVDALVEELEELSSCPPLEPYAGPALLSGLASGLIFHEAIGHRLEGERMRSRSEGRTFANRIGKRILPAGVDVVDDPSLATWEGQPLYGHYAVDDEGVRSRPVTLVNDGKLENLLMSRTCAKGFPRSNGHGRAERHQAPMARMGNLIVRAKHGQAWGDLKEQLMRETRDRNLPYGILIRDVSGGETRTDHYDFQAFKGVPTKVYTVDPKTGRERRGRDVSFIGTPLAVVQQIAAFGTDYELDNSYCFAESGSVPVATLAPPVLVNQLELQRASPSAFHAPILPLPRMR